MKTLNEFINELIELQKQGKGNYSVIEAEQGCVCYAKVNEEFKEIILG